MDLIEQALKQNEINNMPLFNYSLNLNYKEIRTLQFLIDFYYIEKSRTESKFQNDFFDDLYEKLDHLIMESIKD